LTSIKVNGILLLAWRIQRFEEKEMVSKRIKKIIIEHAVKYGAKEIYVFGSAVYEKNAQDIDLGVKGIKTGKFFKFYGELLRHLPKDIDLVDFSKPTEFIKLAKKSGIKIYG